MFARFLAHHWAPTARKPFSGLSRRERSESLLVKRDTLVFRTNACLPDNKNHTDRNIFFDDFPKFPFHNGAFNFRKYLPHGFANYLLRVLPNRRKVFGSCPIHRHIIRPTVKLDHGIRDNFREQTLNRFSER